MRFFLLMVILFAAGKPVLAQKPTLIIPAGHGDQVTAIAFTSTTDLVISGSNDETVKIWRTADAVLLRTLPLKTGYVKKIDITPDNSRAYISCKNGLVILALNTFDIIHTMKYDEGTGKPVFGGGALSPDGLRYYFTDKDITDEANLKELSTIDFTQKKIVALYDKGVYLSTFSSSFYFSKSKNLLMVSRMRGPYWLLSMATNSLVKTQTVEEGFVQLKESGSIVHVTDKRDSWQFIYAEQPGVPAYSFNVVQTGNFYTEGNNLLPEEGGYLIHTKDSLFRFDEITKKLTRVKIPIIRHPDCWAVNESGGLLAVSESGLERRGKIGLYNIETGKKIHDLGCSFFGAEALVNSTGFTAFWASSVSQHLKYFSIADNHLSVQDALAKRQSWGTMDAAFSRQKFVAGTRAGATLFMYENGVMINKKITIPDSLSAFMDDGLGKKTALSQDGTLLAMGCSKGILIKGVENDDVKMYIPGDFGSRGAGCFSADNQYFYYTSFMNMDNKSSNLLCCWKIRGSNKPVWKYEAEASDLKYIANTRQVSFINVSYPRELVFLNALTGVPVSKKKPEGMPEQSDVTGKTNEKQLAALYATGKQLQKWDPVNKHRTVLTETNGDARKNGFSFFYNEHFVIYAASSGSYDIYDADQSVKIASLYLFEGDNEWVLITPDGRFDATENAMKKLYYAKGRDVIPLQALYEKYYYPGLLAALLSGKPLPPLPDKIDDIHPAPKVQMKYVEGQRNLEVSDDVLTYQNTTGIAEIYVQATATDDKVEEIRLFHNGKIVTLSTRNLVVDEDTGKEKKYRIALLPGMNTVRAVALNSQRTESNPVEIAIQFNNGNNSTEEKVLNNDNVNEVISPVDKNATLHLIVVGINQYQNKSMSLNYALADATSFKQEVENTARTVINNIKTYFVFDATADKAGITTVFASVQKNAKPEDVFVFYYAGHGVIGKDREFYLVPTDVSDLKNVQTELEQKGIPSKMLQQFAIDIQAQKQLFILDACQSAGAFENLLGNSASQQKSIAVLARSTGTHWMAASGAQQFANEFSSLGHGVFTYVLLQALKGAAVSNNLITVNTLKSFLQKAVPELMKKYNGTPQYPASYGFGNDFPVKSLR